MKKLISIILSLVMIFCVNSMAFTAFAKTNTKQTAYTVTTQQPLTIDYIYEDYDYDQWVKFVAPSNNYYEFEITNPLGEDSHFITLYNQYGDFVDIAGVDDFSGRCVLASKLTKGQTYYLTVSTHLTEAYGKDYSVNFTVKKHTHDYRVEAYKYSDYSVAYYDCRICDYYYESKIYAPKSIVLSYTSFEYNGKVRTPTVTVKDSKGNKINPKYYNVIYSSGRKNVGKYTVTVKFIDAYSGFSSLKKSFVIKPKGTTISSLTATSKGFKAVWKKQATQTTGYQIQYSTSSKFSNAKTVTVTKNSTTSKTISKLTAKKKYYVRVRTYKTVNGTKYYSAWSSAKSVTTKK